ncbi:NADPH-dependent FMN reductase [Bailinhaonella thermotolerans]|uniref:NADPH-dependent oxidoreductase n=1 Tax=Bailinhaonella thermotolerans TaxID=1070861 RepID=A0A3A4B424_9ACTN|nr:NAD(P)H-dependent oxidoreductase [Bailinhaonella thermotolerans]RJL32120.1 NADPH-dependent oxidoreductase [Bailinhaonella thermotolerans]
MTRIAIIIGSTRPGRRGELVARWVRETALRHRPDVTFDILDLADFDLPLLDETTPAIFGTYERSHTQRWSAAVASYDGFVFVTPEYNHSFPAVLKNAIDFLFHEWNDKAAGFVSYGVHQGVRAVEHLRLVLAEVKVATVRTQVALSNFADYAESMDPATLDPRSHQRQDLITMLDEVLSWANALTALRAAA